MADPKYADLPGIAYDQPDVYESNDLPEADQGNDFYEENDSIERLHISASEAFNKFKGKYLNANTVDFSERLSRKVRTGYDARSGDWELVAEGEKETPLQKYQRLKCEMQELLEEVAEIKESIKENDEPECANVAVNVEQILKQLSDLRLEEAFGTELINNLSDPQGVQLKKLLVQLEQFKKNSTEKPLPVASSKTGDHTEKDIITYQLKYRPEYAKLTQTCRITDLEQRLHRLEITLGTSSDKFSRLSAATNQNSLMEAAQLLSAKSSMLDSAQLDHIEGRLTALTQKMSTIAQQRAATAEDSEKDQMISELYAIVKKTENMSELLPQTIERMVALEALYQQALDFSKSLMQLEALQGQISAGVQNNKSLLQGVQESFALNLDTIQKNILSLDARVKALKK